MYKVLLADDDYPVLELLSEAIDWTELGFELCGAYENGAAAWAHAERDMPDVLVTDIGMPRMDGLELCRRMKERHPGLCVAILSCHSDFHYARQAMRLSVQEYLVKDTLDPADLKEVLRKFKQALDAKLETDWEQTRMKQVMREAGELGKEKFFRSFIQQPLLSSGQWQQEAAAYGLLRGGEHVLPALVCTESYERLKERFSSEQTLHFAIGNVLGELLQHEGAIHVGYGQRHTFLLFPFRRGIHSRPVGAAEETLVRLQRELERVLGVRFAALIGTGAGTPEELRRGMKELLAATEQRFYLEEREIARLTPVAPGRGDLFSRYDEARTEIRDAVASPDPGARRLALRRWIDVIRAERHPEHAVKEWMLKLLLDLRLGLRRIPYAGAAPSADRMHREIVETDSLWSLEQWTAERLDAYYPSAPKRGGTGPRPEVAEACRYVSRNLERRIALEEVAGQLHLNASYFSRLFKKETGRTFIEHVTVEKMERARELLEHTALSVGEIGEKLGYDNLSYFIKTFRSHAGATPMEYRTAGAGQAGGGGRA
ncbi:response regulator transcription factor [Paenibacillus pasadenensis]|uniref:response regulator transcription factor n=1 Tax=Paenibacillus pasadenensis TaxID=217090 RepID=UPI0003F7A382|nr:response regulator [Paenibacillus pasadenensis]